MADDRRSPDIMESQRLLHSRSRTTSATDPEHQTPAATEGTNKKSFSCRWRCRECRRPHLIEAVLLCVNVAYGAFSILNVQYIYHRLTKDAITKNELPALDEVSICEINSSSVQEKLVEIQVFAGLWEALFVAVQLGPPILLSNSIIAYTQKVGRKFALLLSTIGGSFAMAVYLMGNYFDLGLGYLVAVIFIFGLTGGFYVPLACSFVYTIDHVPQEKRTFRYAIMNGISFLGFATSTFGIGTIIVSTGYPGAFTTVFLPFLLAVMYIICLLPESLSQSSRMPQHETLPVFYLPRVVDMLLGGFRAINRPRDVRNSRAILRCLSIIALLDTAFLQCVTEVAILRMVGPSLCMDASSISFACSVKVISSVVGPLLGAKLFYRYHPESVGGIVACVSGCLGFLLFAFTNSGALVLVAFFFQSFSNLNADVYRSMMVKLVDADERAVVHRLLSTMSSLGGLGGRILNLLLFSAFVMLSDSIVFVLVAVVYLGCVAAYGVVFRLQFTSKEVTQPLAVVRPL